MTNILITRVRATDSDGHSHSHFLIFTVIEKTSGIIKYQKIVMRCS
jgi:hypothetical protein